MTENDKTEELIVETDKCKIVKRDGQILAQCGDKESIDLGKVEEEECPECAEAVAIGYALSYVKETDVKAAGRIYEDVTNNKISSDEALEECEKILKNANKPDLVETVQVLKEMMHKSLSQLEADSKEAETSVSTK